MEITHRDRVELLLRDAAIAHESLTAQLPPALAGSLPVDAQGVTRAIDHLAACAGLTERERAELVRPHAINPAVMHARVYGRAPLGAETVIASFVEGARVRADAITALADRIGGEGLGQAVRELLVAHLPPTDPAAPDVTETLRATYGAQERAVVLIAAHLDATAA